MIEVKIDSELKEKFGNIKLGVIQYKALVKESPRDLSNELDELCVKLQARFSVNDILKIESIQDIRLAYKSLGKDPSRYRVSSEALIRRILQGKGIYKVNNIVDVNNLISLRYILPMGSYNLDEINKYIVFRVGEENEEYKGIGKGNVNLSNMPIFSDDKGAFGSPTSDSDRTMITDTSKNLLMIMISFSEEDIKEELVEAVSILERYVNATEIEYSII